MEYADRFVWPIHIRLLNTLLFQHVNEYLDGHSWRKNNCWSFKTKIESLHEAVVKGDLRAVQSLMTRMKLAVSKDENGHGLLHKAVFHGHRDIVDWLIEKYPESLEVKDWVKKKHIFPLVSKKICLSMSFHFKHRKHQPSNNFY